MKPTPQAILEQTRELGPLSGRALLDPTTINKERRTIEVVFATENPVRQSYYDWDRDSRISFDEVLSMKPSHVRMERISGGAPVLNNHNRWEGITGQLGVVEKAWIAGSEARAVLRFSRRNAEMDEVWRDVEDGILQGISVGYRVYEYEITRKEGAVDVYRAIDWEPFEISFAPIQADIKSGVRSADGSQKPELNPIKISLAAPASENRNEKSNPTMEPTETTPAGGAAPTPAGAPAQRSAEPTQTPVNEAAVRAQAIEGERVRVKDITAAVRAAKLDQTFADTLIEAGHDINKARELIIAKFAEGGSGAGQGGAQRSVVTPGVDETDKRRSGMETALVHRSAPSQVKAEDMKGNEYRGMSLVRLAEEACKAASLDVRGLHPSEIARTAMNLRQIGSTDFPIILGNTVKRRMQSEYTLAPQTFTGWAQSGSVNDFREVTRVWLSEIGDFKEVKEGGEYKEATLSEGAEKYKVAKYGEKFSITWETIINDDLNAFSKVPLRISQAARRKQSDIVYSILTGSHVMGDGVELFHADHKNLLTAAAISDTSLAAARKAFRNMKGKTDKDFLNLMLSFLLVGPDKETEALKYTSAEYMPNTQAQINPWKNTSIIVEPRITGNLWFAAAAGIDTVEYFHLEGEELSVDYRQGFDVDGMEIKARMTFGAKAMEYKGLLKNPGA